MKYPQFIVCRKLFSATAPATLSSPHSGFRKDIVADKANLRLETVSPPFLPLEDSLCPWIRLWAHSCIGPPHWQHPSHWQYDCHNPTRIFYLGSVQLGLRTTGRVYIPHLEQVAFKHMVACELLRWICVPERWRGLSRMESIEVQLYWNVLERKAGEKDEDRTFHGHYILHAAHYRNVPLIVF